MNYAFGDGNDKSRIVSRLISFSMQKSFSVLSCMSHIIVNLPAQFIIHTLSLSFFSLDWIWIKLAHKELTLQTHKDTVP